MNVHVAEAPTVGRPVIEPVGVVVAIVAAAGLALPFTVFKANRIVPGDGVLFWDALPTGALLIGLLWIGLCILAGLVRLPLSIKLAASGSSLVITILLVGLSGHHLTPPDNSYARIGIGSGFWLLSFALALMVTDALARMRPGPWLRIGLVAGACAVMALVLSGGLWDALSVMKEYASRDAAFWQEARTHLLLACGSVIIATGIGVPLGIACYKFSSIRAGAKKIKKNTKTKK